MEPNNELVFQTTQCNYFDHPEITFQFSRTVPVPDLERTLIGFFEEAVAGGACFLPGQTVQIGWALLRMFSRTDGTLGVEELSMEAETGWVESVEQSLMAAWYQKEVGASLGLLDDLAFPQQAQTAILCSRVLEADQLRLVRHSPDDQTSGWFVGCMDEAHDHNVAENLSLVRLLGVAHQLPFTKQFFALPPGIDVFIRGEGRISAQVRYQGNELMPRPGSYLYSLNNAVG